MSVPDKTHCEKCGKELFIGDWVWCPHSGPKAQAIAIQKYVEAEENMAVPLPLPPPPVKCWTENNCSIAYMAGVFIHVVNTTDVAQFFRGCTIGPQDTFHSTENHVLGRMMSQDANGTSRTITSSSTLPPRAKWSAPGRARRLINLNGKRR